MKRILQRKLQRVFSTLLIMIVMLVVGIGEAKARKLSFPSDETIKLDYKSTLVLAGGNYYHPGEEPEEGQNLPESQPMTLNIPSGFRLDSLIINGKDYMDPDVPHSAKKEFLVADGNLNGEYVIVQATIVPDTITSPEILVDILNVYSSGSASVEEDGRVVLNKHISYRTKNDPHIFNIKSDSLVIDGLGNYGFFIPQMRLDDGKLIFRNNIIAYSEKETAYMVQKGGFLKLDNSQVYIYSTFVEQEGGNFQIEHSEVSKRYSQDNVIVLKGPEAKTELLSGFTDAHNEIVVESGQLDIKDGEYSIISMKGGSLNVSGGWIQTINIKDDCKLSLTGGLFTSITCDKGIQAVPSSDFLADGYMFAKANYMNMLYPLGKELTTTESDGYTYYEQNIRIVPDTYNEETAAYKAAKKAVIGPNGKDVKVKGDVFEIYTAEGLCWLAVSTTNDDKFHFDFENGKDFSPRSKTINIMNDLDMTDYGEGWPGIILIGSVLDGKGHRISNLDIKESSYGYFISQNYGGSTVANLVVEGSIYLSKTYLTGSAGAFVGINNGRIINCAFVGSVSVAGLAIENTGSIENCYVNPCGLDFGGVYPADYYNRFEFDRLSPGSYAYESYNFAKLVERNSGSLANCYFVGDISFDDQAPNVEKVDLHVYDLVNEASAGSVTNCYKDDEISVETLNTNVASHQQDADFPWVTWAVDPEKQCGKPYLVFEEDTSSTSPSSSCELSGDQDYTLTYTQDAGWSYTTPGNETPIYFADTVCGSTTGSVTVIIPESEYTLVFQNCSVDSLNVKSNAGALWVDGNVVANVATGNIHMKSGSLIQAPEGKGVVTLTKPTKGGSYTAFAFAQTFETGRRLPVGTNVSFTITPEEGYELESALFGKVSMMDTFAENKVNHTITDDDTDLTVTITFKKVKVVSTPLDLTQVTDTVTVSYENNNWYYQETGKEKVVFTGEVTGGNDTVVLLAEDIPTDAPALQFAGNSEVSSLVVSEGSALQVVGSVTVRSVSGNIETGEGTNIKSSVEVPLVEISTTPQLGGSYEVIAFGQPVTDQMKLPVGTPLTFEIEIEEGYELASATIGGRQLVESLSLLRTRAVSTTINRYYKITGDESDLKVEITFRKTNTDEPEDPDTPPVDPVKYYNIYEESICDGVSLSFSKNPVKEGGSISIKVEKDEENYTFENFKVWYKESYYGNWKELKESTQPGEYKIQNIWTHIYVKAEGSEKKNPTGMEEVKDVKVYTKDGSLFVQTPQREQVIVISMTGAVVKNEEQIGLKQYHGLNPGIYIVRIGEQVFKIRI